MYILKLRGAFLCIRYATRGFFVFNPCFIGYLVLLYLSFSMQTIHVTEQNLIIFQDDQSKGQLLPLVDASNSNNRSDDFKGNLLKTAAFNEAESVNFRENGVDKKAVDVGKRIDKVKCNGDAGQIKSDTQNFVMIEPDLSSMGGKAPTNQIVDNESTKDVSVHIQREEKMETVQNEEKHQRKRKRTIMNDKQVALIEKALVDEPDMHRNAASLQLWADKLSDLVKNNLC